jgi:hypothetical protein
MGGQLTAWAMLSLSAACMRPCMGGQLTAWAMLSLSAACMRPCMGGQLTAWAMHAEHCMSSVVTPLLGEKRDAESCHQ